MNNHEVDALKLLEYVRIDKYTVTCSFRCPKTNKSIISVVPFEPYEGKITFSWKDLVFHPIASYKRYYHTPITIYSSQNKHTIVNKAFQQVSKRFTTYI